MSAGARPVERAAPAPRGRRRGGDERLRARRAGARRKRERLRRDASAPYSERLLGDGVLARAALGHGADQLPAGEDVELVLLERDSRREPRARAARRRGLAEHPRAELLAQLSALRRTIAVAGTHGKTTSAAMLVHALRGGGLDPGWLVGAGVGGDLANAHWSEGEWLVVEADESDRSMLSLGLEIALLTNVELDHHASFASLAELREAFREFLGGAREAVVWDRPELLELRDGRLDRGLRRPRAGARRGRLALSAGAGRSVSLAVPGAHNALNAAGALEAGAPGRRRGAASRPPALAGFTRRRRGAFSRSARAPPGRAIYDDYAHHPTEVAAALAAARTLAPRRLLAVFQPHLYSRTALLARELGRGLAQADVVAVLDVYPARERAEDHPGRERAADRRRGRRRRRAAAAGVLAARLRGGRAGARAASSARPATSAW